MTEYWVSTPKQYCNICKCWISSHKANVSNHEISGRHQDNKRRLLREMRLKEAEKQQNEKEEKKILNYIEKESRKYQEIDQKNFSHSSNPSNNTYFSNVVNTGVQFPSKFISSSTSSNQMIHQQEPFSLLQPSSCTYLTNSNRSLIYPEVPQNSNLVGYPMSSESSHSTLYTSQSSKISCTGNSCFDNSSIYGSQGVLSQGEVGIKPDFKLFFKKDIIKSQNQQETITKIKSTSSTIEPIKVKNEHDIKVKIENVENTNKKITVNETVNHLNSSVLPRITKNESGVYIRRESTATNDTGSMIGEWEEVKDKSKSAFGDCKQFPKDDYQDRLNDVLNTLCPASLLRYQVEVDNVLSVEDLKSRAIPFCDKESNRILPDENVEFKKKVVKKPNARRTLNG